VPVLQHGVPPENKRGEVKVRNCIRCDRVMFEIEKGRQHHESLAICLPCYKALLDMVRPAVGGGADFRDLFGGIFNNKKQGDQHE